MGPVGGPIDIITSGCLLVIGRRCAVAAALATLGDVDGERGGLASNSIIAGVGLLVPVGALAVGEARGISEVSLPHQQRVLFQYLGDNGVSKSCPHGVRAGSIR